MKNINAPEKDTRMRTYEIFVGFEGEDRKILTGFVNAADLKNAFDKLKKLNIHGAFNRKVLSVQIGLVELVFANEDIKEDYWHFPLDNELNCSFLVSEMEFPDVKED